MGNGADDETRTRDPHLGKVMRYQLRYIRKRKPQARFPWGKLDRNRIFPVCAILDLNQ